MLGEEGWSGHVLLALSQTYTCRALIKPSGSWAQWFMTVILAMGGGGAEAGVQGMRGYRVRLCLKTKQPQLSFSRLATLPLTPQDSLRKQACSSHLASFTLFSLGFSPSVSNPRSKPFATEVAGSRAILSVCCHLSEPAAAQLL